MVCMAQSRVVKGVVFNADGSPLAGITVSAENSTTSTQSSDGGQFEMTVSPYTKYVVATAEGYLTARAEIDGSFLVLTLKVDKKYIENKLKAEEEARLAAEKEAKAKAKAEEEARLAAEKEAKAKAKAEEEARLAAEKDEQTKAKSKESNITTDSNTIKQIVNKKLENIDIGVALTYDYSVDNSDIPHIGLNLDFVNSTSQTNFNIYGMFNTGVYIYDIYGYETPYYSYDVNVGVGCGIPMSRNTEFTTYTTVGGNFSRRWGDYSIVEPGVRFTFRFQPFSILLGIGYQFLFEEYSDGGYYWDNWQLSLKAGIKWTF